MNRPCLVVFDVDGTLVDSQAEIVASMHVAFANENLPLPARRDVISIVGLSLDHAMQELAAGLSDAKRSALVAAYRQAYFDRRQTHGASPLFDGAREALDALSRQPSLLMGVATGKSKRGLDALIEAHQLERYFVTRQVADFHPSKPHPSMLQAALDEAGAVPEAAAMVGDTSFDMDMAGAAGCAAIGVEWGYHLPEQLTADILIANFSELPAAVARIFER